MAPVAASLEELHLAEVGRSESLGAGFVGLLQKCGKLRHLELRGNFVLSSSVISAITGHQSLQCLRIQNNSVLDDQTVQQLCQGLAQAVSSVVKLTTLDLSSSGGVGRLSDRSGKAIGSMLAAGVRLRELSLRGQQLSLGGLAACIGIHQNGKGLLELDLSGNNLGLAAAGSPIKDDDVALWDSLRAALAAVPELKRLCIGDGGEAGALHGFLDDADPDGSWESADSDVEASRLEAAGQRIPLCRLSWLGPALPSLLLLDASGANIGDSALGELGKAMAVAGPMVLQELELSRNFITEDGVQSLVLGLRKAKVRLRRLGLAVNRVGDEGSEALALELASTGVLPDLRYFGLRANAIGAVGPLCRALRSGADALMELDLRENLFGDEDARRLQAAVPRRFRRICLQLEGSELSEEFLQELAGFSPGEAGSAIEARASGRLESEFELEPTGASDPFAGWPSFESEGPAPWEFPSFLGRETAEIGSSDEEQEPIGREKGATGPTVGRGTEAANSLCPVSAAECNLTDSRFHAVQTGDRPTGQIAPALADTGSTNPAPAEAPAKNISRGKTSQQSEPAELSLEEAGEGVNVPLSQNEWQECLDTLDWVQCGDVAAALGATVEGQDIMERMPRKSRDRNPAYNWLYKKAALYHAKNMAPDEAERFSTLEADILEGSQQTLHFLASCLGGGSEEANSKALEPPRLDEFLGERLQAEVKWLREAGCDWRWELDGDLGASVHRIFVIVGASRGAVIPKERQFLEALGQQFVLKPEQTERFAGVASREGGFKARIGIFQELLFADMVVVADVGLVARQRSALICPGDPNALQGSEKISLGSLDAGSGPLMVPQEVEHVLRFEMPMRHPYDWTGHEFLLLLV
ncbi:unnamed protein product [Polarella glacialis]|uniref:Protein NLRC3 n=1 Tax=Polarella glacialis TaxID=89957 RepID=A0A813DKH2_POLGL|nr:unnamed protein product [Polarella glacialis]